MTDCPVSSIPIQQEAVAFRAAVSSSVGNAIGGAINQLFLTTAAIEIEIADILVKTTLLTQTTLHTWNAPANLHGGFVIVTACGGGGGGGGASVFGQSGGGGSGVTTVVLPVTAGVAYLYRAGSGGAGGASNVGGGNGVQSIMLSGDTFETQFAGGIGGKSALDTNMTPLNSQDYLTGRNGGRNGVSVGDGVVGSGGGTSNFGGYGSGGNSGANGGTTTGSNGNQGYVQLTWFEKQP